MRNWEQLDEWTDTDREKELIRLREEMTAVYAKKEDSPSTAGRLFVDYRVMVEALRECARRYLDATDRGEYGNSTLENEVRFFVRLGESQVIYSSHQRQS